MSRLNLQQYRHEYPKGVPGLFPKMEFSESPIRPSVVSRVVGFLCLQVGHQLSRLGSKSETTGERIRASASIPSHSS